MENGTRKTEKERKSTEREAKRVRRQCGRDAEIAQMKDRNEARRRGRHRR